MSEQSKQILQDLKQDIFVNFDLLAAENHIVAYGRDRISHFINNIEPFPLAESVIMYVITNYLAGGSGEFSLGNPLLTAYIPTFVGFSLMLV